MRPRHGRRSGGGGENVADVFDDSLPGLPRRPGFADREPDERSQQHQEENKQTLHEEGFLTLSHAVVLHVTEAASDATGIHCHAATDGKATAVLYRDFQFRNSNVGIALG